LVLLTFVGLGTTSNKNLSKAKFYIALFIDDCRNKINHLDDQHGGVWYGNNNSPSNRNLVFLSPNQEYNFT